MQREIILQKIDDYVNGKLSAGEIEELWVEILDKPEYVEYISTLINVKDIMESRKDSVSFWRKNRTWLGAIAALLAVVTIFGIIRFHTQNLLDSAVQKISSSELESPMATRSINEHFTKADSLLNQGYWEATNGNESKAVTYFNELALKSGNNADVAKAFFNLGILHYNSENYEKAESSFINALDHIKNDNILREKTTWYLGNTYIKLGELKQARQTLSKVYNMNGIYKEKASDLLNKINKKLTGHY